jgi:hypothetical protein
VVAMARSMMKSKGMPGRFWGEAVSTAVYLLNRAPTKSVVGMTPYEAWYRRKPSVDHLRTFGCVAHVKTVVGHLNKLADRSTPMVMIGYEAGTKAYRAYNPVNKKLVVTRDVLFEEEKSWNWSSAELVEPISSEIFTVVYSDMHADDQGAGSRVAADTADTNSGPEITSTSSSVRAEAGASHGSAWPHPHADENAGTGKRLAVSPHAYESLAREASSSMPCRARTEVTAGACTILQNIAAWYPLLSGHLRSQPSDGSLDRSWPSISTTIWLKFSTRPGIQSSYVH